MDDDKSKEKINYTTYRISMVNRLDRVVDILGFCSSMGMRSTQFSAIFRHFQGHCTKGKRSLCICLNLINFPYGPQCTRFHLER